VILNGAGVVIGGAIPASMALAERLMRRSASAISTTTPSPVLTRCSPGRLGYNGSKAGMELIQKADVVLALAPG
jgi:sulfoacetaldehyde acetyltransferase